MPRQSRTCCPTCGRTLTTPKAKAPINLDAMTPDQRKAYFHKIAPVEDVRFALRTGVRMPEDLAFAWRELLQAAPTLARGEVYRLLWSLTARLGAWSNAEDRRLGVPAVGSENWHLVNRFQDTMDAGNWSVSADLPMELERTA